MAARRGALTPRPAHEVGEERRLGLRPPRGLRACAVIAVAPHHLRVPGVEPGVAGDPPKALTEPTSIVELPDGDFLISEGHSGQGVNLEPGTYTVTVEMPSFSPMKRTDLVLAAGQSVVLEFKLQLGGLTANYATYAALITWWPLTKDYPEIAVACGAIAGLGFNYTAASRIVFRPAKG